MDIKYILAFNKSDYEFIRKKYIDVELKPDNLEGQLLSGRYEFIKKIQEKKNTIIYEVHCQLTEKTFIAEVHRKKYDVSDPYYMDIWKEMEQLSKVKHENVLSIFDFGNDNGIVYAVKEYFSIKTLGDYLIDNPKPYLEDAISLSRQILLGMSFVEERICEGELEISNLDICPENIFVSDSGKIKINFPWPYEYGFDHIEECENYHYMSPEAARGIKLLDLNGHVYSFGCVLYRLFTGRTPFIGDELVKLAMEHLQTVPESPTSINELIPKSISDVIEKCMQKDPSKRYSLCEKILRECNLLRM